jgi:AcrR family transcriptional regulator
MLRPAWRGNRVQDQARPKRVRKGTAEKLLQAAADEFNDRGFAGTDTNRIARRAGFAPQTFYRWYEDKIDVFIQVYGLWERQEADVLRGLLEENAPDARVVEAVVAHHRAYLIFRRSLRLLSLEQPKVRAARAATRLRQVAFIRSLQGAHPSEPSDLATTLFMLERLSDALAEGEIVDMGLDPHAAEDALAGIIHRLRHPG